MNCEFSKEPIKLRNVSLRVYWRIARPGQDSECHGQLQLHSYTVATVTVMVTVTVTVSVSVSVTVSVTPAVTVTVTANSTNACINSRSHPDSFVAHTLTHATPTGKHLCPTSSPFPWGESLLAFIYRFPKSMRLAALNEFHASIFGSSVFRPIYTQMRRKFCPQTGCRCS